MTLAYPIPWTFPEPVTHLSAQEVVVPDGALRATLHELCARAAVALRATAPERTVWLYHGSAQYRAPDADLVGVPTPALESPEAAIRALEALAHSFHDHAARACVCGRGLFRAPDP